MSNNHCGVGIITGTSGGSHSNLETRGTLSFHFCIMRAKVCQSGLAHNSFRQPTNTQEGIKCSSEDQRDPTFPKRFQDSVDVDRPLVPANLCRITRCRPKFQKNHVTRRVHHVPAERELSDSLDARSQSHRVPICQTAQQHCGTLDMPDLNFRYDVETNKPEKCNFPVHTIAQAWFFPVTRL